MSADWPSIAGVPQATAVLRSQPEDFRVDEELGFAPEGEGEHVFLRLQKRRLNTADLAQRLSSLSGIHPRDIAFSGMKDRNAVTRQWFSVRMAGKEEPDWQQLEASGDVQVMAVERHRRKLKRGVHRSNRFTLVLRELNGDRVELEQRLGRLAEQGAPNYFGPQRFGRDGRNLEQAKRWMLGSGSRMSRQKRGLLLSVLRAQLFNSLLADRVVKGDWHRVLAGDTCVLHGTRSQFLCERPDEDIQERCRSGDLHPALPLWGRGLEERNDAISLRWRAVLAAQAEICAFLAQQGLDCGWRPARLIPDDFCWDFCDDGSLQLEFRLGAGCYATALLAELVRYTELQA